MPRPHFDDHGTTILAAAMPSHVSSVESAAQDNERSAMSFASFHVWFRPTRTVSGSAHTLRLLCDIFRTSPSWNHPIVDLKGCTVQLSAIVRKARPWPGQIRSAAVGLSLAPPSQGDVGEGKLASDLLFCLPARITLALCFLIHFWQSNPPRNVRKVSSEVCTDMAMTLY